MRFCACIEVAIHLAAFGQILRDPKLFQLEFLGKFRYFLKHQQGYGLSCRWAGCDAGKQNPELVKCMHAAWTVAQIAAFQRLAHKFANSTDTQHIQFQFAVVSTDFPCPESHAAQLFLAQHAVHGLPTATTHGKPGNTRACMRGELRESKAVTTTAGWMIWHPCQQQRCMLQPGPKQTDVVADVVAVAKAKLQDGEGGGALRWAAAVHVLDATRQECFLSAETALEAAMSGSGEWEKVEEPFAV